MSSAVERGLIIGMGSADRRDDGVGPYVVERLCKRGMPAITHAGDGAGLLELWEHLDVCVVVDAIAGRGQPGAVSVITDCDDPNFETTGFVRSTHRIGLAEAVALGRALGRLPVRLLIIGIAGADFGYGGYLSPMVARAADQLIDRLAAHEDLLIGTEAPDLWDFTSA